MTINILVAEESQAEKIIQELDSSTDKLKKFIELKRINSVPILGRATNTGDGSWRSYSDYLPSIGHQILKLDIGSYFKKAVRDSSGYHIVYLKDRKDQQLVEFELNKINFDRIAQNEINYMNAHNNFLKNKPEYKAAYVQPKNKKEPCAIYMGYIEGNEYFKEDSWRVFWDGSCKNGFATGLGREIEQADMTDKWQIAVYKKGQASNYIIQKDVLNNTLVEGLQNDDISFLVITDIKFKQNDIDVTTIAGERNSKIGINLLASSSPFWNGSYIYEKDYMGFRYMYVNTQANDSSNLEFDFFIETPENGKNGWAFSKYKNQPLISGEWINNKASQLALPKIYNDKADSIIKEINIAQEKAFNAQIEAKKVKKQYLKRICKDSVKVSFMDNDEYKDICNPKSELALMQKINEKLNKISEAKIAKLEQERYTVQQQKEEQHRQELIQLERNRLAEITRHNQEAEAAVDTANFQQGMKNLTDQINNMTPKTYNVNMYHY